MRARLESMARIARSREIAEALSLPPPSGWGEDELSSYLTFARQNQFATFANKRREYRLLSELDDCFLTVAENLNQPIDLIAALLLLRAHSAFRSACTVTMAGQVSESFALLRSCLECAAYALHINAKASLAETWLRRHESKKALRTVRNEFTYSNTLTTITQKDRRLGEIFSMLYERSVDFGAHPNERAIVSSMATEHDAHSKRFLQHYLHSDGPPLQHALKSTAEVGLCSLFIFQHIFPAKFMLLGVQDRLTRLRRRGL